MGSIRPPIKTVVPGAEGGSRIASQTYCYTAFESSVEILFFPRGINIEFLWILKMIKERGAIKEGNAK